MVAVQIAGNALQGVRFHFRVEKTFLNYGDVLFNGTIAGYNKKAEQLHAKYADGDKEVLYFKDFNSGAMIENVVSRAKKSAIKDGRRRVGL